MTEFVVSVYEEGEVIGAEVKVSSGETIESIEILDAEGLNAVQEMIQNIVDNYASKTYLSNTLENPGLDTTINSTKLGGHDPSYYATATHEHDYAPVSHADTTGQYGVATDSSYGHVKTINGLSDNSYVSGRSLAAYQGKVLDDKITAVKNEVEARGGFFVHDTIIQKGQTLTIYCYNADGSFMPVGTTVSLILNNQKYDFNVSATGQVSMPINLQENQNYPFLIYKANNTKIFSSGFINVW